jgi:hypothetical protein
MRRRLIGLLILVCTASGCALLGHHESDRAADAQHLLISELRYAWPNRVEVPADSTIVVIHMLGPCNGDCSRRKVVTIPKQVARFVADSLHARLAETSGMQCNKPTPTIKRVCRIPGDPSLLTMTVPPLSGDTIILVSDWDLSGKGSVTKTMYIWRNGHWIFPDTKTKVNR